MTATERIVDAIAELVAAKVLAKLGTTPRVTYSTAKSGPFVAGKSRAWMLSHVRLMPGARKVGRDWIVSAEDFDLWARAQDTASLKKKRANPAPTVDDIALADSLLDRGGFRSTKAV